MVYQIDKKWTGWDLNSQPERFPYMIHNRTSLEHNITQTTICGGFYEFNRSQIRCPMNNIHERLFSLVLFAIDSWNQYIWCFPQVLYGIYVNRTNRLYKHYCSTTIYAKRLGRKFQMPWLSRSTNVFFRARIEKTQRRRSRPGRTRKADKYRAGHK